MAANITETPPARPDMTASRDTFTRNQSRSQLQSESYEWTNESTYSGDVERWLAGDTAPASRAALPPVGRLGPALPPHRFLPPRQLSSSGLWYAAALVLPLLNINGNTTWRCSPSAFLNTAELMLTQMAGYCGRARSRLRCIARDHGARDLFAGAMDVVLVLYAIGFLILSLYQASVFHQL